MLTQDIQELEKAKARVAELEAAVAAELHKALASLPAQYGFASAKEFAESVQAASEGRAPRPAAAKPAANAAPAARPAPAKGRVGAGKRARITDETRGEVKKMVKAGMTGNQIAAELGISLPSVQNIKKAFGLVKARK